MRSRIDNPNNNNYQYYGGSEIKADEFILFVDFYDKMHEAYLEAVKKFRYLTGFLQKSVTTSPKVA